MPKVYSYPVKQHQMVSQTSFWSQPPNHLCAGRAGRGKRTGSHPRSGFSEMHQRCFHFSASLCVFTCLLVFVIVPTCLFKDLQGSPASFSPWVLNVLWMETCMWKSLWHDAALISVHMRLTEQWVRTINHIRSFLQLFVLLSFHKTSGKSPLTTLISSLSH